MGGKEFGVVLGSVTSLQPWLHTTAMEVEVSWFGEGSPWLGGQNSTSARGMLRSSTTETMSLSRFLCPEPVSRGMHPSFKTTLTEPIMHVLSKITCSFTESWLSHDQQSPQTCHQLNICGTFLGYVSGDSFTSHRTSLSLLMYSRRNGTRSPSNHWAAHQENEVLSSGMPCGMRNRRPYSLLRLLWNWYTDPYQTRCQVQVTWLIKDFVVDG